MQTLVNIRKATWDDEVMVYELINILEGCTFAAGRFQEIYKANLAKPLYHYFVAEQAGEIVGFVSCHGQHLLHHNGLVFEIQELVVLPKHRNMGIGKQLLYYVQEFLTDNYEYEMLELCSNFTRKDAHRFYLNNGFKQSHYKFTKLPEGKDFQD